MACLSRFLASCNHCEIWNDSDSPIKLRAKSGPDGSAPSDGMLREELGREIPPKSSIIVNSSKYDLNGNNCGMQIVIDFVATEIAANSVEGVTAGVVYLHCELKAKGQVFLACGDGGEVAEVSDKSRIEEIKMTMNQNKKMKGSVPGFFRRFIRRESGHGGKGKLSSVELSHDMQMHVNGSLC